MRKLGWIVALLFGCSKSADKGPAAGSGDPGAETPSVVEKGPAATGEKPHRRKHEDRKDPVVANAPPLKLEVTVTGKGPATWTQDAFDKVAKYTKGNDGEARDVWSLRELAHQLVGPTARVIVVASADGSRTIDAPAWNDGARTPLLHTTRRGTLKFRWADGDGKWAETEVKDVTKIEVAP